MKKQLLFIVLSFICQTIFAQTNKEKAQKLTLEAIDLMESGSVDRSINVLKECVKLDPESFIYTYEMAYAYTLKKEYKKAIKCLNKSKKCKDANSQVYQMLGNSYSYLGKPYKALEKYQEGLTVFPNAGNLYLESGNIYYQSNIIDEAKRLYKIGIEKDPMYPSNYYRLAKLSLTSEYKLDGLIYGELFMNIERGSGRTGEMSKLLYDTYKSSISHKGDTSVYSFNKTLELNSNNISDGEIKLPLQFTYFNNLALAAAQLGQQEVDLEYMCELRKLLLENYMKNSINEYPLILMSYQNKVAEAGHLEAYNYYILQQGKKEEMDSWFDANEEKYNQFVEWYIMKENVLNISAEEIFLGTD
ncbi:tetratricopeptide repeat protein [Flammeovirga pacifica]|uniref:Uncharacterized protein n=1 Tax=Flammeovirga pacifica TaxID=915059 RepID=A0A1S1YT61_FLAPC|nr:tetratricopeptide repeat protein [Flammeovirga pacifica]OHX63995.1 hypothetical protein NH26_20505 [Flammeovirga pacifica]